MTLSPAITMVETEYGWVLLDERAGEFFSLNPSGALALQTLLDGGSLDTAVQQLTTRYAVDAATARTDLEDLLHQLEAANLVTR